MVKPDFSRDYYGDLELPPSADLEAVKKQFRKLALKYHPDRNPGRESEVNSKFQIIQAAQEILTNPEQKARYDAHRARMRYTAGVASGVVGNPWQNVSSQFPAPPRRPPNTTRKPTGAERYANLAKDVPPASPRGPKNANADASSYYKAWTDMKPKPQPRAATSADPKPTAKDTAGRKAARPASTPRTASQKVRAEASFARKAGFAPSSPMGDEPPVTSKNYASTRSRRYVPSDIPSRDRPRSSSDADSAGFGDTFLDPRQSTPYQTHGGEKFNPFDGVPLGRAKSARSPRRPPAGSAEDSSPRGQRQRSASVPDNTAQDGSQQAKATPSAHAGERPRPGQHGANGAGPFTVPTSSTSSLNSGHAGTNGSPSTNPKDKPSVYAPPNAFSFSLRGSAASSHVPPMDRSNATAGCGPGANWSAPVFGQSGFTPRGANYWSTYSPALNLSPEMSEFLARPSSSEGRRAGLNPFESKLCSVVNGLADKHSPMGTAKPADAGRTRAAAGQQPGKRGSTSTDARGLHSFAFQLDDDTFTPSTHRFTRNSTDNINTRFVAEDFTNSSWQFNAGPGPAEQPSPTKPRSKPSNSRPGRRSPEKTRPPRQPDVVDLTEEGSDEERGKGPVSFNAEEWSQKISPQIFEPQPPQRSAGSPTRAGRAPAKKLRPARANMGPAGSAEQRDTSSGPEEHAQDASMASNDAAQLNGMKGTDSPVAMDIDPPTDQASAKPPATGARNIPVEPSRPEWRAGHVNGVAPEAKAGPVGPDPLAAAGGRPAPVVSGGSEDSEEFKTTFADFKKVEPFAPTGLGSFGDLQANLPFDSKPSARVPIKKPKRKSFKLELPEPPQAPHPPATLAIANLKPTVPTWQAYVNSFRAYMHDWHTYNTRFVEHFQARDVEVQRVKTASDFAWLDARDDSSINEYLTWFEQDRLVREKWAVACDDHEKHVREFAAFRDKMMK